MAQRVTIVSDVQNIMKEEWHWIEKETQIGVERCKTDN